MRALLTIGIIPPLACDRVCQVASDSSGGKTSHVTGFGKTLRMGFFVKIEFAIYFISTTLPLSKFEPDCALGFGDRALAV